MDIYPDITHSYKDSSFDKDIGWSETTYSIVQKENSVLITIIDTENGSEVKRSVEHGIITKWYSDSDLVQIKLDNNERRYFDLKKKELTNSVELIFVRSHFPDFDYRNENQIQALGNLLFKITSPFFKNIYIPDLKSQSTIWSEDKTGLIGELTDFIRMNVSFHQFETGLNWFGMWMVVNNLSPIADARTYIRRMGTDNWDLVIKCPPEYHVDIKKLIQTEKIFLLENKSPQKNK